MVNYVSGTLLMSFISHKVGMITKLFLLFLHLVYCCNAALSPEEALAMAADSNAQFALDLMRSLAASKKNVFFSPYSISYLMGLTSLAAAGDTLAQINQCMHFDRIIEKDEDPNFLHAVIKNVSAPFIIKKDAYSLYGASRIFAQKNFNVLSSFQKRATRFYHSDVALLEDNDPEECVNSWVANNTRNKIKTLFEPGTLSNAQLVMVSAVHFQGSWVHQFNPKKTKKRDFWLLNGNDKKSVAMMSIKENFPYAVDEELSARMIEMPYEGGDLSMFAISPIDKKGLPDIIKMLTPAKLNEFTAKLSTVMTDVKFPRFKLDTSYSLSQTLEKMGLTDLFCAKADLSELSDDSAHVTSLVHRAALNVDEKGTEAAAATGTVMERSMPPEFNANRPFLFTIVDKRTNMIIFMGALFLPVA